MDLERIIKETESERGDRKRERGQMKVRWKNCMRGHVGVLRWFEHSGRVDVGMMTYSSVCELGKRKGETD